MDALPAAYHSGNMEAAHAAICAQLELVTAKLCADDIPVPDDAERLDQERTHLDQASADPYEQACGDEERPSAQNARSRIDHPVVISGRCGTSPERKSRSRSRSQDSAASSDQEGKLRQVASRPGQRTIRSWFAAAEDPRRG